MKTKLKPLIPAWLDDLELTPQRFRIVCHIARRGSCYASIPSMAEKCRVSPTTVKKGLKELVAKGVLKKCVRRGKTNVYTVECCQPTSPDQDLGIEIAQPALLPRASNNPTQSDAQGIDQIDAQGEVYLDAYEGNILKESNLRNKRGVPGLIGPNGAKVNRRGSSDDLEMSLANSKSSRSRVNSSLHYPPVLSDDRFRTQFELWMDHRMGLKKPGISWLRFFQAQLDELNDQKAETALATVKHSTLNGYTGLYAPNNQAKKFNGNIQSPRKNRNDNTQNTGKAAGYAAFEQRQHQGCFRNQL